MTVKKKIMVVCLSAGMLPLVIVYWVATNAGLGSNRAFDQAIALALAFVLFVSFTSPHLLCYWFFFRQLEKIKSFCASVKKGRYDSYLEVPNESADQTEENEMIQLMRDMNWMAHHVRMHEMQLQQTVADLKFSQAEIEAKNIALEKAYAEQRLVQEKLEERTLELQTTTDKVCNLLNNAGQGFISFGDDLKIAGEYSSECLKLFHRDIEGADIAELLFPGDEEQQQFIQALLRKNLREQDPFMRDIYLTLLPKEISYEQTCISIQYKVIAHPSDPQCKVMMLILTDVTQQKELEQQIQKEKDHLNMVVKAVTHAADLIKAIREYTSFCTTGMASIVHAGLSPAEKLNVLFRSVHTWKGTFSQLAMHGAAKEIHCLETKLGNIKGISLQDGNALNTCLAEYPPERMLQWLEEEIQILQDTLGEDFLSREDRVFVERSKLLQLEERIRQTLPQCQARSLIEDLRLLRCQPVRDLLTCYPDYVVNLAARYGKEINPFDITGGETLVDPERYREFVKALNHVFRNAVAHGMESGEERMGVNKEMVGNISCNIEQFGDLLILRVTDDGRGIDPVVIKEVAAAKGICDQNTLDCLTDEKVLQLIFSDGFSSSAEVTELAGRGVGLSAVKMELEKLGGWIQVTSFLGVGTEFRFVIPLPIKAEPEPLVEFQFGEQVVKNTGQYLQDVLGVQVLRDEYLGETDAILPLRSVTTFIDVVGYVEGKLVMSADAGVVRTIAAGILGSADDGHIESEWLESAFGEMFNTVAGNSLQWLPETKNIDINVPLTIQAEGALAKFSGANLYRWNVHTNSGQLTLSLIIIGRNDEDGACTYC